jgi:hypothetical protein
MFQLTINTMKSMFLTLSLQYEFLMQLELQKNAIVNS